MSIEQVIKNRITELITESERLKRANEYGQRFSDEHSQQCKGWLVAANHIVKTICPDPQNAYNSCAQQFVDDDRGLCIPQVVGSFGELLKNLYKDIELGLIQKIRNKISAEIFDDFLDHAKAYLKKNKKNEAGVISGVVFEDTIRRISRDNNIPDKDQKLDDIISSLDKNNIITSVKAKRARAAAHIRTKATHAQWDEFEIDDVKATIDFTNELIYSYFDNK